MTDAKDVQDTELVDTQAGVSALVDILYAQPTTPPSLYVDLEGINLSRHGTISILQIFVAPQNHTYLVDVYVLGERAFSTAGTGGKTLTDVLESERIPKVFFDVRMDSDALFSHYSVRLAGIQDLQLMKLALRQTSRRLVRGLSRCIENDCPMTAAEQERWKATKEKGLRLFAPERGGSYQVFNQRPLPEEIRQYCVQDVQFLPRLWAQFDGRLSKFWREQVETAVTDRVALSQSPNFNGEGKHMALAPKGWEDL